ncbi:MAG: exo-alpha-sialidase [Armatimonadetes bacterium]|nr:exo-alpha-sialidase [Armatimonadota bacterium]
MRSCALVTVVLALCSSAHAAGFVDLFDTPADTPDRAPFIWPDLYYNARVMRCWSVSDGVLRYRTDDVKGTGLTLSLDAMGIGVTDATDWSLEVAFRHVEGTAPRPEYEALAYVRWRSDQPGQMRILMLTYDARRRLLIITNGRDDTREVPADLEGEFHPVRMTVGHGLLSVYLDGARIYGPEKLGLWPYTAAPMLYFGPVTSTEPTDLCFEFDYLAFTDEGAFAPGADDLWSPASAEESVAKGMTVMDGVPDNRGDTGIALISRERGTAAFGSVMPACWRGLAAAYRGVSRDIDAPFYTYPDAEGPVVQHLYPDYQALDCGGGRCVGVAMLTRGVGDTATGYVDYKLWYRLSVDGGETWDELRPMVEEGEEFSPAHPNRHVWIGRNGFCYAAIPPFLLLSNGEFLLPFYFAPLDESGAYYNPLNAYTFGYIAVARGRWNDAGDDVVWRVSDAVTISPELSSRGMDECAIIELSQPGRVLMVIRGSNQPNTGTQQPVKWRSLSEDYGRTWSEPEPFTYADGSKFMSPSACSALIRSSVTGKVYWLGNISRVPPVGNSPRYPLVMAELDEQSLGLKRETVTILDDRGPEDSPDLQLSNFKLLEDPATGHIVITLNRLMPSRENSGPTGGAHSYIVEVH